jgi:hypothetical protein
MSAGATAISAPVAPTGPRAFNPWLVALAVVVPDAFMIFVVLAVVLAFLVLLMKRSVAEKGAHLAAE